MRRLEGKKIRREEGEKIQEGKIDIGLIGVGLFARGTLLPAMKRVKGIRFEGVATLGGLSGKHVADKFRFNYCTTDYKKILEDENINLVFVLTRHNSHARFVCEALKAGKAVFVEKPLCLTKEELGQIVDIYNSPLTTHNSR